MLQNRENKEHYAIFTGRIEEPTFFLIMVGCHLQIRSGRCQGQRSFSSDMVSAVSPLLQIS
jgi:hypothetical protein